MNLYLEINWESLRQPVEVIIPFEDRVVTSSINRGTPFIIENKTAPISRSIFAVIDKIKFKLAEQDDEELPHRYQIDIRGRSREPHVNFKKFKAKVNRITITP